MNLRAQVGVPSPMVSPAVVTGSRWIRDRHFDECRWRENVGHRVKVLTFVGVLALALLNVGDAVTTHMVLQHTPAGAREANPLAGALIANGSLLYVKMAIVLLLGLATLRDRPRLGLLVCTWGVAGLYAAAVLSNILLLRMLM